MTRLLGRVTAIVLVFAVALSSMFASAASPAGGTAAATGRHRVKPVSTLDFAGQRGALSAGTEDPAAYWTEARMAAARPRKAPKPARRSPKTGVSRQEPGRAHLVAGVALANEPAGGILQAGAQAAGLTYPFPFTRRPLEPQLDKVAPYRTIGQIFFSQGPFDYVCSGASVVSGPRNIVLTAGHCLHDPDTGVWSTNVVFVPARRGRAAPYGKFPAARAGGVEQLWVLIDWATNRDLTYDIGAFAVRRNAKGKTLQRSVGALGFAFNQGRVQHWDVFGYPALSPFDGKRAHVCEASHAVDDLSEEVGSGPDPMGIGCDMTAGSSGGPWIKDLRRGSSLNGIVSYAYLPDQPKALYSPHFDQDANALRCAAAIGNPGTTSC